MIRRALAPFLFAALALGGLIAEVWHSPATADNYRLCAPIRAGAAAGPARVTAATSGTTYSTDGRGCVLVDDGDLGDFQALGYRIESPHGSVVRSGITTSASGNTLVVPAGAAITRIVVEETSGTALGGNLEIGTANGGTEVCCVGAQGVQALSVSSISDAQLKRNVFSSTAPTTLYVDTSGTFSTGAFSVTIIYAYY
jgi:hypothetical protein